MASRKAGEADLAEERERRKETVAMCIGLKEELDHAQADARQLGYRDGQNENAAAMRVSQPCGHSAGSQCEGREGSIYCEACEARQQGAEEEREKSTKRHGSRKRRCICPGCRKMVPGCWMAQMCATCATENCDCADRERTRGNPLDALIARLEQKQDLWRGAHWLNLIVRRNAKDEHHEADFLKTDIPLLLGALKDARRERDKEHASALRWMARVANADAEGMQLLERAEAAEALARERAERIERLERVVADLMRNSGTSDPAARRAAYERAEAALAPAEAEER
jgi:hypothetical protein